MADGCINEHIGLLTYQVVVGVGLHQFYELRVEALLVLLDLDGHGEDTLLLFADQDALFNAIDDLFVAGVRCGVAFNEGVLVVLL